MSVTSDTPDWLDAPSVGGFLLADASGTVGAGGLVDTGVFACGSAPFLILNLSQNGGSSSSFGVAFYADAAGTVSTEEAFLVLSQSVNPDKRMVVPVMGAYCKVHFQNGAAPGTLWGIRVWASSARVTPAETLGGGVVVLNEQGVSVPASTTSTFQPNIYLPGQATFYFNGPANTFGGIQKYNTVGWDVILQVAGGLAVPTVLPITLPADDYRMYLFNNTGSPVGLYGVVTVG